MSQHDFNIANQGFPNFRSDLNNALAALASLSSGDAEPSTTYANQLWYETDTNKLWIRNEGNSAWLELMVINQTTGSPSFNSGSVGIGTAAPAAKLEVNNAATAGTALQVTTSGAGNNIDMTDATGTVRLRNVNGEMRLYGDLNSGGNGNIVFHPQGTTERMRITSAGDFLVAKIAADAGATAGFETTSAGATRLSRSAGNPLAVNRLVDDGALIIFQQAGTTEGNISVSGTTVSYNGGHLSRWAQFPDNSRPDLLKGTVMSNLDQMSQWGEEDNEQLNCVQVSAVEGDANVAGVFVAWDSEDDGYNDILLAMTGDMVIRIGAGVTVERGDLLMSAGDGTAKPQGDDIVRAKTIAKVTSTHVSHTYADGSYAVPCVLMAC